MQQTVGTTPVQIAGVSGKQRPTVQNLGPGVLYIEETNAVTAGNGFQIAVGAVYEFASGIANDSGLWAVASLANTDVRVLALGA